MHSAIRSNSIKFWTQTLLGKQSAIQLQSNTAWVHLGQAINGILPGSWRKKELRASNPPAFFATPPFISGHRCNTNYVCPQIGFPNSELLLITLIVIFMFFLSSRLWLAIIYWLENCKTDFWLMIQRARCWGYSLAWPNVDQHRICLLSKSLSFSLLNHGPHWCC